MRYPKETRELQVGVLSGTGQPLPPLLPADQPKLHAQSGEDMRLLHLWPQTRANLAPLLLWIFNLNILKLRLGNKRRSQQNQKGNTLRCTTSRRFVVSSSQTNRHGLKQLLSWSQTSAIGHRSLLLQSNPGVQRWVRIPGSEPSPGPCRLAAHPGHPPAHTVFGFGVSREVPSTLQLLLNSCLTQLKERTLQQKIRFSQKERRNAYYYQAQLVELPSGRSSGGGQIAAASQPSPSAVGSLQGLLPLPSQGEKWSPCHRFQTKLRNISGTLRFPSGFRRALFSCSVPLRTEERLFVLSEAEVALVQGEVAGMQISCFCSTFLLEGLI